MRKELEIGTDYGFAFGFSSEQSKAGCRMIYLGGSKWRLEKPGFSKEVESQKTNDGAIEYINRPAVHMGM